MLFDVLVVVLVAPVVVVVLYAREFDRRSAERYRREMRGATICPQCNGTGRYSPPMRRVTFVPLAATSGGFGGIGSGPCPQCQGTGYLPLETTGSFDLPVRESNGLAVASLVLTILGLFTVITGVVAAIPAYVARKRSWDGGRRGAGMATAALIGGPLSTLVGLVVVLPIELALYDQWRG
jgi:hypothetical protein